MCCAWLLSCIRLFVTHGLQPTRILCPWGFSRQEYWSGLPCPPPGDLPNPGIEPRPPALQADSLPAESPGKSKNTRVGSLSLLQGIFPTKESNRGLLQCRWILYQLSNQESPISAHSVQTMLPVLTVVLTASRESSVYFFQHANFTLHLYGIKYFLKFISNFQLILRVTCRSFYSHLRN